MIYSLNVTRLYQETSLNKHGLTLYLLALNVWSLPCSLTRKLTRPFSYNACLRFLPNIPKGIQLEIGDLANEIGILLGQETADKQSLKSEFRFGFSHGVDLTEAQVIAVNITAMLFD